MTVFQELVQVYDRNASQVGKFGGEKGDQTLLPIAHVSVKIPLEVTLSEQSEVVSVQEYPGQSQQLTVIPATSQAAIRSSNAEPFPLQDKVKYVAGEFAATIKPAKKKADTLDAHQRYMKLLKTWADSEDAPTGLTVIYKYLTKNRLMTDLTQAVSDKSLLKAINSGDAFVRFNISNLVADPIWKNKTYFDSWTRFYEHLLASDPFQSNGIDYISGEDSLTTKAVEKNISGAISGAKLISANDDSNFTYQGMFLKDTFYSLGYVSAQKMTHALKWLIQRQGLTLAGRTFLFWTAEENDPLSDMAKLILGTAASPNTADTANTGEVIARSYHQRLFGLTGNLESNLKVNILFVDAATTGRMSMVYYDVMESQDLKTNLERWANQATFVRQLREEAEIVTPSFNQVLRGAYQIGGAGSRYDTVVKQAMTRLVTMIIHGRNVPDDIMRAFYRHVQHPNSYHTANNRSALSAWYGDLIMFVAVLNYNSKGVNGMALDESNMDRSYLFGRLLALANSAERMALGKAAKSGGGASGDRQTTAIRFMTNFAEQPASTWQRIIQAVVRSYLSRVSPASQQYYLNEINHVTDQLQASGMTDEPLSPLYLSGFAAQSETGKKRAVQKNEEDVNNDK